MVDNVVDLIGVGDLFVLGFLFGMVWEYFLIDVVEFGCICVVSVIIYVGVWLEWLLKNFVVQSGFEV